MKKKQFDFDLEEFQKGYDEIFLKWKKKMDCSTEYTEYKLFDNVAEYQVQMMYKAFMDGYNAGKEIPFKEQAKLFLEKFNKEIENMNNKTK